MSWYALAVAGAMVFLFSGFVAADNHLDDTRDMTIEMTLERQREMLMRRPGAVGVGIGMHDGKSVIVFMIDQKTPETLAGLPREFDGHPLVVEEVGEITAY